MRFFLKKVVDMSICLLSQFGCLHCDKEHSLSEFHRQYRVCGEIGSGGFGRVYKAYRLSDGLPVAVKCIRHKRVSNWTLVERWMIPTEICFMEECQDVQGVIRLICWFTSRHGFLIVMERPANFMDLFDLISTFGWLDEGVARGIFSQIVETVAELYKQHSVIHRDIKDENVVVDLDTGTVWLVDFGAAELLERAKKQRFQGTLSYSPPEVFQRECYYPLEGTVWSLGILLYILVVGKPPFQDELQICTGKLRFPRIVSSECRALIRRCLCPTAESRISLEELQQHAWLSCETTTSFFTNFESEWRRRKRDSLISDCHRGELSDDDDEDCSYRTEAGAEPGPLTIPPMICAASVTKRSPTSSSFVEHHHNNNSPSFVMEESAVLDDYDERPRHESAEMCSSFPSLPSTETETGFETAPEYDDWRYEGGRLGFSSLSQCCCTSAGDDLLLDGCAFVQQHFIYAQQKCTDDDEDDQQQQRKASAANSLPSFGHPIHRVGFRATQSDRGSARSSTSDSNGRRSNSFTSDDSFTSSTTYFSANSHKIPLPEWSSSVSSCVIGAAVCLSNSNSKIEGLNINDEEDDELTLRAEIPRQIVLKKERRRSPMSAEDQEEQDEWDADTIRVDINSSSCAAGKCQNNVSKKTGDESPSATSSSSSSPVIEQHQQMNKWQIEKQHLTPHSVKQLFKSDGLVEVGDGQQQQQQQQQHENNYSARRKGGDRYRRRKGTHNMLLLDGIGRPVDRRRRRLIESVVVDPSDELEIPKMINPILSEIHFKWYKKGNYSNDNRQNIKGCELTKLFQNFSANFMKMEGAKLHLNKWDSKIQAEVEQDFGEYCKKIEGIERKADLNTVRYDLVLNFKLNAWKDVHDRTEDVLKKLAENKNYEERAFADGNENYIITPTMTELYNGDLKEMRESISKIETLKENDGIDLLALFDRLDELARKIVEDEMPNLEKAKEELERLELLEKSENYKKERLFKETENLKRQIEDKEKEANNLKNEINLLQKEVNQMPKKQRENAAIILAWLKSNGTEEITEEAEQILQKICTLSELSTKVAGLKAKMKKSQRTLTSELGDKLSMDDASTSQKSIGNTKKLKKNDKVTEAKITELKKLQKLQQKLLTSQKTLNELTTKISLFANYCGTDLWELVMKFCGHLNETKMSEKIEEPSDYEKTVEELRKQIDEVSHGVEEELAALLREFKIEWGEKELVEDLSKKNKEKAEIDKKLTDILMKKEPIQKEIDTLEKELKKNRESARKKGKNLRQMLEEMMKNYGKKMVEQKKAGERMNLLR